MEDRIKHEIEHGKKIAANAEEVWNWSSPAGQVRAQRRTDLLINIANISQNDSALEIGCGTGFFTEKIYKATGAKITAIDISEDLLSIARVKVPNVDFRIDDAMNLSFPDNSFDVVYGSSIIHHLEFDKAYKEFYRVLKKGGRMIFAEPNMLNPQILIQKNIPFIKKWMGDSPDETAIIRWVAKNQMKKVGFNEIKIIPYDFLHPAIPGFMIKGLNAFCNFLEKIPIVKEIAGSVIIYGKKI